LKSSPNSLPPPLARALEHGRARLGRLGAFPAAIHYFHSIGSTNDVASTLPEGAVVIAGEQTSGRGRRGHGWFSPPGCGLYVSVVLAPSRARSDPLRATRLLTLTIGVALAEGIGAATGLAPDLKWPNDLCVGRRKLGGILAEASMSSAPTGPAGYTGPARSAMSPGAAGSRVMRDTIVAGYGINVSAAAYPPELGDRATCLESELGRRVDADQVLVETLAAVAARYDDLLLGRFDAILDAWRSRAAGAVGRRVTWSALSGPRTGVTAGIDDFGALLVETEGCVERIVAGEVSWS
jgi:BirA family biotin operon repressor/biotin-[acetyl-CoA-carboxylase] ligase